ncbi:Conjugal transfer protein [Pseudomonas savastanoi pv. glycinea]|nr:Conjugal transfer protein [Pseudomonas savastanoi pv. glycinea]
MSNPRYPEEFKIQAVNQVTEKKLPVADVAARLGVSTHSLYAWIKRYSNAAEVRLYQAARGRLLHSTALPDAESPSQWLLRLVV